MSGNTSANRNQNDTLRKLVVAQLARDSAEIAEALRNDPQLLDILVLGSAITRHTSS